MCSGIFSPKARKSPNRCKNRVTRQAVPNGNGRASKVLPVIETALPPEVENAPKAIRAEVRGKARKKRLSVVTRRRRKQAVDAA